MNEKLRFPKNAIPIVTTSNESPRRLTSELGDWIPDLYFYISGTNVAANLAATYRENPATQELKAGDPRAYLSEVFAISYLGGQNHRLGVVLEMPLPYREDKVSDTAYTALKGMVECLPSSQFAKLTAALQADLQALAAMYPAFEFSLAHGEATKYSDLVVRAFRPLGPTHILTEAEHDEIFEVEEALAHTEHLSLSA